MFETIRRWLGGVNHDAKQQEAFKKLNAVAPLKHGIAKEAGASGGKDAGISIAEVTGNASFAHAFVCREAVLDRGERIAGYEFSLTRGTQTRISKSAATVQRAYDDGLLHNLVSLDILSLLGERLAFIRLSPASLQNPLLDKLAGRNAVVMIGADSVERADYPEVMSSLTRLGEMGIKHGWRLTQEWPDAATFLAQADFAEIASTAFDGIQLKMMGREFRARSDHLKLIGGELQSFDEFNLCFQCGFDYFQGQFVTSRENWKPQKSEINRLRLIEVLNMIRAGAEFEAIANCLKTEPVLTFKLLRYINSPGIGLQQQVGEIMHALMILGRDRFYRWLSLLLFDFGNMGYRERVLNEQALARARFILFSSVSRPLFAPN